ncbi:Ig-like domain-containing protein [Thalassotalea sp. ND16A]|uniref:Ig-like domain-containing protein n=1 Tax=Thalassotalea sp. ND16A TaxID=1535422 RepID=UPI00051D5DA1|nr:Ig-like domain-containing protein [Thalassotalea sp. ND16A]KGJ91586.1 hypothetical protein ND16A_1818 [Thalassotalea sp. ND16A]
MKRLTLLTFGLFLVLATILFMFNTGFSQSATVTNNNLPEALAVTSKPNEMIIGFKPGVTDQDVRVFYDQYYPQYGLIEKENLNKNGTDQGRRLRLAECPETYSSEMMAVLRSDFRVEYAEPNYLYSTQLIPNDPFFPQLWGLHNTGQTGGQTDADIDVPAAWDVSTSNLPVLLAVIDTGVDYTHEDLAANIWTNPGEIAGDGLDNDNNGYIDDIHGINAISGSGDPFDDNGHGTHVAGTIAAIRGNGIGVAGVGQNIKIIACKFLSSTGGGTLADAIECIRYVNDLKHSRGQDILISNHSWGGGGFSQAIVDALAGLDSPGMASILHVAAAGNANSDNELIPFFPASYELSNVLAVAATDHNDLYAIFSNFGSVSVDVAAPGGNILSTVPTGTCQHCVLTGYKALNGTSMASPHVAGTASLVWGNEPTLTADDIKQRLLSTVEPLAVSTKGTLTNGRINAMQALNSATPPDVTPPTVSLTNPNQNAIIAGTITVSATAVDDVAVAAVEFFIDGLLVGQLLSTAPASLFTGSWDTTSVLNGTHNLTAQAVDAAGNVGTSLSVSITVQNTAPPVSDPIATTFSDRLQGNAINNHNLTIDAAGIVDVNLSWDDDRADPLLTVFDPNNNVVAIQGGLQPIQISFTATIAGVYVFEIQNQNNMRKADYVLQITHTAGSAPPPDTDITAPDVSLLSPAEGSKVSGSITNSATASDNVGVTQVQFFVDGVLLGTDTTAPYSASWNTTSVTDGAHTLTARAFDAAGNTGFATAVNVTVDNSPPALNITSPADGATVSAAVTITATGSDPSGVTQVQFFVDGVLLSTDTVAPYSTSWNTTSVTDGAHTLTARASDNAGNTGTSTSVNVTVDNSGPAVNITSPAGGATVSAAVTITAAASDPSGVTQVQFFVDGVLLSTDTVVPYSASWNTTRVTDGAHTLTAQASDTVGNTEISTSVNVTVDNSVPQPEVLSLSVSGVAASINRGDEFRATETVTNAGGTTAAGLTVTVTWSPLRILQLENPPNQTQSIGSVAAGGSSNVSWLIQGDKQGSGTITFTLNDSDGATVDVITQSITVNK